MDKYALIDLDQMEPSIVRRRLRRWSEADEEAIRPVVVSLQDNDCLRGVQVIAPRYETNVYPLYFFWAHRHGAAHRDVYERVWDLLPTSNVSLPPDELKPHVWRLADTEIDILVEDVEYFAFIEAKEARGGAKVKFEKQAGVHQLVRQYIQGKILERAIGKKFAFATIGANNAQVLEIALNPIERALLQLVGEERKTLEVVDIAWSSTIATGRAGA